MRYFAMPTAIPVLVMLTCLPLLITSARAETLNDPTRPPDSVIQTLPEAKLAMDLPPKLTGVKADGKASFAIINDQMLRIGEKINGYTLISVSHQQATLLDKNRNKLKLTLNIENFKKSSEPRVGHKFPKKEKKSVVKSLD